MVPLKSPEIKLSLEAIRDAVPAKTRLHILGFAKADDIDEKREKNETQCGLFVIHAFHCG